MLVGCLGDVAFEVSSEYIATPSDIKLSHSAKYATHDRHLMPELVEYSGMQASKLSFEIRISAYLGANPETMMYRLEKHMRNGDALTFVLGGKVYGTNRWVIESIDEKPDVYDGYGNIISTVAAISLLEYAK